MKPMASLQSALLLGLGAAAIAVALLQPPLAAGAALLACGLALLTLSPAAPETDRGSRPPVFALALSFLVLLAMKDLLPTFPLSGEAERRAALAGSALTWPATARNPQLGAAAAHLAFLLLLGALGAGLIPGLAGSARRLHLGLQVPAWLLAAFGLAVVLVTTDEHAYGPGNCVGVVVSKNSAGTLVALGLILHAGLTHACLARSRVIPGLAHGIATVALTFPLLRLGSWTALVALATGGTALFALFTRAVRAAPFRLLLGLAGAAAAMLALALLEPRLAARVAAFPHDYRWQIWQDTLPLARTYPLWGAGLGAFEEVYPLFGSLKLPYDARLAHPDSSWVRLVLEWGALPVGLALAAGLAAARRLGPRLHPGADPDTPAVSGAIAAAAGLAWLASGLTDNTLHRPETLVVGAGLGGLAAAAALAPWRPSRRHRVATATALLLAAALGGWAAHAGRTELRWGLLDPARVWAAAVSPGNSQPPTLAQVARFHAAVRLQHRAVSYPAAAARFLQPQAPATAFAFWQIALVRAGEEADSYFAGALAAFPRTPAAYWQRLAVASNPDLLLLVPGLTPAELAPAITAWIARPRPEPVALRWGLALLAAVERTGRPDLIVPAIPRLRVAEPVFWERTAQLLRTAGQDAAAWQAVGRLLPAPADAPTGRRPAPGPGPQALLQLRRYPELRDWLLSTAASDDALRRQVLVQVCAVPAAPAWFHLQLARELAAAGDFSGAVDRALLGLAAATRP